MHLTDEANDVVKKHAVQEPIDTKPKVEEAIRGDITSVLPSDRFISSYAAYFFRNDVHYITQF